MILAIDPGARTGLAVARGGELLSACVVARGEAVARAVRLLEAFGVERVVIERPIIRNRTGSKGDPNQILALAMLAGELSGALRSRCPEVQTVAPAAWKGSLPKRVHHAQIERALPAAWLNLWAKLDHNGRDAIALAWWASR